LKSYQVRTSVKLHIDLLYCTNAIVFTAYGTVGISVGLPDKAYSFCGDWHALSKLILCAVMLRGRHRGLPVAIDKAVLLPRENMHTLEEEDARIRKEKAVVAGLPAPC
jgi:Trk-type K+ transport system membrane component